MSLNRKKLSNFIYAATMLASITVLSSCERYQFSPPVIDQNTTLLFATDIQPIFTANCIACHGGSQQPDLRAGNSYASLTTGGYVTNTPAESSRLYVKMTSGSHISRSTDTDKLKVLTWIKQGAKNN